MDYLEAWTRDDKWVNRWYVKSGFNKVYSYLQVFLDGEKEIKEVIRVDKPAFKVMQAFVHYTGNEQDYVKSQYNRVHECNCYEKSLK